MKVSELKEGMLLRFKKPRLYRFLYDEAGGHWFDCGQFDTRMRIQNGKVGQPLMVYLGQEKVKAASHYGGFMNIRKVPLRAEWRGYFPTPGKVWRRYEFQV